MRTKYGMAAAESFFWLVLAALPRVGLVTPEPAEPLLSSQDLSHRNKWSTFVVCSQSEIWIVCPDGSASIHNATRRDRADGARKVIPTRG